METKHTPEPWEEYAGNIRTVEANEKYGDGYRAEFRRRPIADVVNIRGQEEVNKANAQRIVSCVNACKGINPEVVPELSEVLCIALTDLEQAQKETHIDFRGSIDAIRAVLAKATK